MSDKLSGKVRINGTGLYYQFYPAAHTADPIVFLNGILMTAESWIFQARAFAGHYPCLFHDFRGQLKSDKPAGPYTMALHAQDLKRLLDHLGISRCHLVGTSYGGEVAMAFADAFPESVLSLTLIACFSHVDPVLYTHIQSWIDVALACPDRLYNVATACVFSSAYRKRYQWLLTSREKWFHRQPPEFFQGVVQLARAVQQVDHREFLKRIQAPVMVVCGQADVLTPVVYSRQIVSLLNKSEFFLIPDAAHGVVIEQPDAINTLIGGFIGKVSQFLSN